MNEAVWVNHLDGLIYTTSLWEEPGQQTGGIEVDVKNA
jgi:hypothetical protein